MQVTGHSPGGVGGVDCAMQALTACPDCDLLLRATDPSESALVRCPRCDRVLAQGHPDSIERSLALAFGALVLFAICNAFPVVGLEVNGERIEATIFSTALRLYMDGMWAIAALFLLTTAVAPLLQLLAMLTILAPLSVGRRPPGVALLIRLLVGVGEWGMIEVFVLGVLVSIVKLAGLATVIPGIALWSFAGLMLLLTGAAAAFDARAVWARLGSLG